MFQSKQEELLHTMSRATFGDGHLFCPDLRGKNREPADLAWVSGRNVILIYCKSGKKSREKQDRGNFQQSKWWMRNWNNDNTLGGKSADNYIEFKRSDIDKIYILLINDAPNDDRMYIANSPSDDIRGLYSVTFSFLIRLFSYYPNAYDLMQWIDGVVDLNGLSEAEATGIIVNLHRQSFVAASELISRTVDFSKMAVENECRDLIQMLKEQCPNLTSKPLDLGFADVSWLSGALYAGTYDVETAFQDGGILKYAWAKGEIRGRTFIVLVSSSLLYSDKIYKQMLEENESKNFLFIAKFGALPEAQGVWTYFVGHSLEPDSRA